MCRELKICVAFTTRHVYNEIVYRTKQSEVEQRMKIKLRVEVLESLQKERGWNDKELAKRMEISRSRLWRAKLNEDHPEYCSPGKSLIAGALKAFPEKSFDDLFFLNQPCSRRHNETA